MFLQLRDQAALRIQSFIKKRQELREERRMRSIFRQVHKVVLIQRAWRNFTRAKSAQLKTRVHKMQRNFQYFEELRQKMEEDSQIKIAYRFRRAKKAQPALPAQEIPKQVTVDLSKTQASFKSKRSQVADSFKSKKPESQAQSVRKPKGGDPNMIGVKTNQAQNQASEKKSASRMTEKRESMKSSHKNASLNVEEKS